MSDRYIIIPKSQSCHCCFEYTIVDTTRPLMINNKQFQNRFIAVCEVFEKEDADLICAALNGMHSQDSCQCSQCKSTRGEQS